MPTNGVEQDYVNQALPRKGTPVARRVRKVTGLQHGAGRATKGLSGALPPEIHGGRLVRLSTTRRLRRLALPLVAACGLTGAAAAPAVAASPCSTHASARTTTLCLINAERDHAGVRPIRLDAKLRRAAVRHSRDMVAQRYFAHESRNGARFSSRIADTGWMSGRDRWAVGENLAWGSGSQATPRSIVAAWMHSAGHRHNLLDPRFRVIGIGIAAGAPVGANGGATYTTDFGS
jgi:uncharacterized protein YkwD